MVTGRGTEDGDALRFDSLGKGKREAVEEEYTSLVDLGEGCAAAVKVMVCRKWDAHNSFGKYLSTEYILSDCEENSIQCSARNNISHRFVSKLHKGSVYSLKNFSVLRNKEKFRVRKNDPHTISLEGYTVIKKLTCETQSFVRFPFELIPLEEIEFNDSAFLIDVVGHVSEMSNIRTTKGGAELVEFELVNERDAHMRVTLWAPLCNDIFKRKSGDVGPYVVILPGMNIKEFRGEPYLSSTAATTLFDAPDIPQIAELLGVLGIFNLEMQPIKLLPPLATVGTVYQILQAGHEQKETRKKSRTFHVTVRVVNVRTKDGWFYFSCGLGGCKKRVSRAGTKFMCQTCNKVCEFPRSSYRMHLSIADATSSVVVTMFDEFATHLIGKKAAQLLEDSSEDGDEDVLPAAIVALTNTSHTFELKTHTYYDQGGYESFTVSSVVETVQSKVLPQKRAWDDSDQSDSHSDSAIRSNSETVEVVKKLSPNSSVDEFEGDDADH